MNDGKNISVTQFDETITWRILRILFSTQFKFVNKTLHTSVAIFSNDFCLDQKKNYFISSVFLAPIYVNSLKYHFCQSQFFRVFFSK